MTPPQRGPDRAISRNDEILLAGNTVTQEFVVSRSSLLTGSQVWDRPYDGPANGNDFATGMAFDFGGNLVVIGTSNRQADNDPFTIRYAAGNGATLWEAQTQGTVWYLDFTAKPVIDAHDDVYVASSMTNQYHTVKYSGRDGRVLWENFQLGAAFETPRPSAFDSIPLGTSSASPTSGITSLDCWSSSSREAPAKSSGASTSMVP